jgi:hypothetical protein
MQDAVQQVGSVCWLRAVTEAAITTTVVGT